MPARLDPGHAQLRLERRQPPVFTFGISRDCQPVGGGDGKRRARQIRIPPPTPGCASCLFRPPASRWLSSPRRRGVPAAHRPLGGDRCTWRRVACRRRWDRNGLPSPALHLECAGRHDRTRVVFPPTTRRHAAKVCPRHPAIHGGPSSVEPLGLIRRCSISPAAATPWLEVNYRGSSGYGRSYLQALVRPLGRGGCGGCGRGCAGAG